MANPGLAKTLGDAAAGKPAPRAADAAFDIWLKRGLHKIYDDVASEPIPEDLLRLIQDDRGKHPDSGAARKANKKT